MKNNDTNSDSTIPSYLYGGLCEYGESCSCSIHGISHSYSNEILRWSKKELEAYHKVLQDDATSVFRGSESPPDSPSVENEPKNEVNPSTPTNEEEESNLVVPDTPEDVIASRAKVNPKKRV
ncbi:unnamed protein product [Amaranthus hypochondriacus]